MKTIRIVPLLLIIFSWHPSGAQSISLRTQIGGSLQFTSEYPKLIPFKRQYFAYSHFGTGDYRIYHPARIDVPHLSILFEFAWKSGLHIESGVLFSETAVITGESRVRNAVGKVSFDGIEYKMITDFPGTGLTSHIPLYKIPIYVSYDLRLIQWNNHYLTISPVIGINSVFSDNLDYNANTPLITLFSSKLDGIYPDSLYHERWSVFAGNKGGSVSISLGTYVRLHNMNRELVALKVYYEQGFSTVRELTYELYRNKQYHTEYLYTRGSGIHLKLSVPIRLYQFK